MSNPKVAIFVFLFSALAHGAPAKAQGLSPAIASAIADAARPDADKAVDADRKPGEMMVFAGIKPGDKIIDLFPGGGYFTRVFAKTTGPKGKVYAYVPEELLKLRATAADGIKALSADINYANVELLTSPAASFAAPGQVDVIWTSRNYHDMHNKVFAMDVAGFNKAVFAALKPGGFYIVLDHAANVGAPADVTETLHRIDPEVAKKEILAAGFVLDGTSDALKNVADDHSQKVFETGVRGKTDQFLFRFKKPL